MATAAVPAPGEGCWAVCATSATPALWLQPGHEECPRVANVPCASSLLAGGCRGVSPLCAALGADPSTPHGLAAPGTLPGQGAQRLQSGGALVSLGKACGASAGHGGLLGGVGSRGWFDWCQSCLWRVWELLVVRRGREALSQLWNNLSCKCTAGVRGSSVPGGAGGLHWGCIGGCTGASLGLDPLRTTEMCGGDGPGPARGQAGNGHHPRDPSSSTAPILVLKPAWSPGGHSQALSGFGGRDGAGESWQRITVAVSYLDLLFQERPVLDTPSPSPGNGRRTWAGVAQPGPVVWDPSPAPAFRSAELVWSRTASRIRVPHEGKAGPLPGP